MRKNMEEQRVKIEEEFKQIHEEASRIVNWLNKKDDYCVFINFLIELLFHSDLTYIEKLGLLEESKLQIQNMETDDE